MHSVAASYDKWCHRVVFGDLNSLGIKYRFPAVHELIALVEIGCIVSTLAHVDTVGCLQFVFVDDHDAGIVDAAHAAPDDYTVADDRDDCTGYDFVVADDVVRWSGDFGCFDGSSTC